MPQHLVGVNRIVDFSLLMYMAVAAQSAGNLVRPYYAFQRWKEEKGSDYGGRFQRNQANRIIDLPPLRT